MTRLTSAFTNDGEIVEILRCVPPISRVSIIIIAEPDEARKELLVDISVFW